jgi:hypothetical protein
LRAFIYRVENAGHYDSWACTGEFIKKVYRLRTADLDPLVKMPCRGIDVTLASCFTGSDLQPCTTARDSLLLARFPRLRVPPTRNQARPDIRPFR